MATATPRAEEVEKVVKATEVTGVTLELSVEEAHVVKYLTAIVSGPHNDFMAHAVAVYDALRKAGVGNEVYYATDNRSVVDGNSVTMPSSLTIRDAT